MRSLERRFRKIEKNNPRWSSHTCFAVAVRDQKFNKQTLARYFNKLVDKTDYAKEDKKQVVKYLIELNGRSPDMA